MVEYVVKNANAPYFYFVRQDGKIMLKARQGNLAVGAKVSGNVAGALLVDIFGLKGEAKPPYCMYLKDLEPAPVDPGNGGTEPEPEPGGPILTHTIQVYSDGSIKIDGNAYP